MKELYEVVKADDVQHVEFILQKMLEQDPENIDL